jgi:hypothetical protein
MMLNLKLIPYKKNYADKNNKMLIFYKATKILIRNFKKTIK